MSTVSSSTRSEPGAARRTAIESLLDIAVDLGVVEHVSLWRGTDSGAPECIHLAGAGCPSRSARDAARAELGTVASGSTRRGLLQVVRVPGGGAVLVARPRAGARERSLALLRQAAAALVDAHKRASEPPPDPAAELLAAASERRVARIGFDLHDGPIQTVAALVGQTRRAHCEVAQALGRDPRTSAVLDAIDDLKTRVIALEWELRTLCHSLEGPAVLRMPFERVVEEEIVTLQRQTGARTAVELSGRFDELTPSQRIALLRVIQEAIRNIREHSSARTVALQVHAKPNGTTALIENDGRGFDVDAALAQAVRDGRVGLIGMMERIRLLGGTCAIRSCRRGPTTVRVSLPRWEAAATASA